MVSLLRTNSELVAGEVALAYKGLCRVERTFKVKKSVLQVRPLYHRSDEAIVGHIVASFLALRLEVDMQRKLEDRGIAAPWVEMMRELKQVQTGEVEVEGKRYTFRTKVEGYAREAFIATGTRIPAGQKS